MKTLCSLLAASLALTTALADGDIAASVTLGDSSVIKGTVAGDAAFAGDVVFQEDVKLPVSLVRELAADGTNGEQVATLANGDKFHFAPATKALTVTTLLGELSIPFSNIRRVSFSPSSGDSADGLIYYCTFDSPEAVEKPVVGPAGKFLSGRFVEGKVGKALAVEAGTTAAEVPLPGPFFAKEGCIEFWARLIDPPHSLPALGAPRFFTAQIYSGTSCFCLEWNGNNGSGGSGLTARAEGKICCPGIRFGPNEDVEPHLPYSVAAFGWHHYALVWNSQGVKAIQSPARRKGEIGVFFDGKLVAVSSDILNTDWPLNHLSKLPTLLSFPIRQRDCDYGKIDFAIDDFKIWNYDRTDFGL